jgi:hypothetical protein
VTVSFAVQKLFSFMSSIDQSFVLIAELVFIFIKLLSIHISFNVFPILSCKSFTVLDITLRSLMHFYLILVQGERLGSSFNLLQVAIQFPSTIWEAFCQHMFFSLAKIK